VAADTTYQYRIAHSSCGWTNAPPAVSTSGFIL
jgi:hypothetical protein